MVPISLVVECFSVDQEDHKKAGTIIVISGDLFMLFLWGYDVHQ